MDLSSLISQERIASCVTVASKKRALEELSRLLAGGAQQLDERRVFETLLERERLGSTGLGRGVAIPHGRLSGLQTPIAAFVQLSDGVDFDALDGAPVALLFGLLVPDHCTDEHLQILAELAAMLRRPELCRELRDAGSSGAILELLTAPVTATGSAG
jgi:PTS system nitrogen regulatory IIA component